MYTSFAFTCMYIRIATSVFDFGSLKRKSLNFIQMIVKLEVGIILIKKLPVYPEYRQPSHASFCLIIKCTYKVYQPRDVIYSFEMKPSQFKVKYD